MNNSSRGREIRAATRRDWPVLRSLLAGARLPVADLDEAALRDFRVVTDVADRIIGAIGLQAYGETGLLRSLVVAETARAAGCGSRLVKEIERIAVARGVRELWLLTIDAGPWFAQRGFQSMARNQVPQSIRETAEFGSLCPESALLMMKSLRQ